MDEKTDCLIPLGLMGRIDESEQESTFDLEQLSWEALQRASLVYEQGGSVGEDLRHWLQAQAGGRV